MRTSSTAAATTASRLRAGFAGRSRRLTGLVRGTVRPYTNMFVTNTFVPGRPPGVDVRTNVNP
jgi:hypothetical protein